MPESPEELVKRLLTSALKGDAKSQYHLGVLYQDGKTVPKDLEQSAKWYTLAAKQEHVKAQLYLGMLYQRRKDYKNAAVWYVKAAGHGEPKAQYYLGLLFLGGKGVKKDIHEALRWLNESASNGHKEAGELLDKILSVDEIDPDNDSEDDDDVVFVDGVEDLPQDEPKDSPKSGVPKMLIASFVCMLLLAAAGVSAFFLMRPVRTPERPASLSSVREPDANITTAQTQRPAPERGDPMLAAVRQAVNEGKIPRYILQRGQFTIRQGIDTMMITGQNVRFRSEPNTGSAILANLSRGSYVTYCGEWVSPNNERWVLSLYDRANNTYGWIYGQYTEPLRR